jgi:superfamily I DNA/RNA helicase
MLVPTALRRRATLSRLLAAQPAGVLVQPQVFTLQELADRILAAAGRPVHKIGDLARRQVIRRCLARLDAKQAAVLGPARETPGLVDALDALFRELKAARVEPDVFGRAVAERLRTPRNRALAILYDAYQKALQAREVYDDAGQFWHAAALVAEGKFGPFADLALLVADGFQDFAPAQLDMLESLAGRAARTVITLTWQPDRPNLFGVTGRTRERLRERFGKRLAETVVDEPSRLPPDLERVRTHLFRLPEPSRPKAAGAISIIQAAGRTREVEEVARRIADLVRGGANRPASVAVLVRSLGEYAALVREVFPRYGVPCRVETGQPAADCPAVRAAMALVRLVAEGYSYQALARLIQSSYFVPGAFGADAEAARRTLHLAREANIWAGRKRYAEGLAYLEGAAQRAAGAVDETGEAALPEGEREARVQAIRRTAALLDRLFAVTEFPAQATRRALAERFRAVIRAAGLWSAAQAHPEAEGRARDLKALAALEQVLDEVALLDEDAGAGARRGTQHGELPCRVPAGDPSAHAAGAPPGAADEVALEAFVAEVQQGLRLAAVPAEEPPDAPVVVLDVRQGRALAFDHVFVLGLAEKEFPRRGRQHPFFDDNERQGLRRGGVNLADAGHDAQQEMLLYYLALTRARNTLTLAYPSLDAQGRPALPSHYVEEVKALFAPGADGPPLPVAEVSTRDLALAPEQARCRRELLAAALFDLWGPGRARRRGGGRPDRPDRHLAALDAMLAQGPAAETALAGLAAEWEREHGDAFGPFDGVLASSATIVEELCRRFPGHAPMSASRLEAFGACPFRFLAGYVLGLEPIEAPSPDLGPMDLGLIYHGLLERFFSEFAASKPLEGRLAEAAGDAAAALLEKTAAAYFRQLEGAGRIGSPALWHVQKQVILRDVRRLLAWHAERLAEWRVARTEAAFGSPPGTRPGPGGHADPVTLRGPHGPVLLHGRIDRLDLRTPDAGGHQVIDYKTGPGPSPGDLLRGTSFQLPVYLWAAEKVLNEDERGALTRAFFLPIRDPKERSLLASADSKGRPREAFRQALEQAEKYIHRFIDAMRRGQFPVWPRGECSDRCDFHEICRFAEWRLRRKWQQHPIPGLEVDVPEAGAAEDAGDAREEADA